MAKRQKPVPSRSCCGGRCSPCAAAAASRAATAPLSRAMRARALAYPEAGRTKTMTLPAAEVDEVRAAVERYNAARAELDASADAGVAALRAGLAQRRRPR